MSVAPANLADTLALADQLREGRGRMNEPQDLPGRYGRVIRAVDRLLALTSSEAVVGGGWAVWRHGYVGRVTQDVDIVLAADRVDDFLRTASVAGFEVLPQQPGRWPKVVHKETGITVDILPEGTRPGTTAHPAPTTLPHPSTLGARGALLTYIPLPALVELKLAAGHTKDESDMIELIRANPAVLDSIRKHLATVHVDYLAAFDRLTQGYRIFSHEFLIFGIWAGARSSRLC